ncbi:PAS domain-containing protein [Leptodesmis sichuanensis]|uniref:PAS domain-containing protein n=1 Tax=Leptodesmis sichuanensis TaxID=2906798 RepID=UPI001F17E78A|nr:PAS domain-containing protein [Leptodesmis sichuanensis]UIE40165.1 PAS domain-containing protein [Leptodesmis sichuanensis A121]
MMQYSQNLCLTGTPILIFWILLDGLLIGGALLLGAIALWRWREGRSWRHWQQMQADLQQANAKLQQETCDRQQVEAALRDSATRLSLALKAAKAGTWQWDQASNQAIWSEENFRLLGYDPQDCEACYENWLRAVHPDDRATVNQHISQLMAEQHGLNLEYRVMWPDRTVRWLADIGEITYDPDGNPTGMISIQIDITNRKQAELALAESESQQRLILENIPSFIAKVNREAEILFLNRLAPGFTPEQVIGQSLDLFTAPESREPQRAALAEVFATGQTVTLETHGTGAHGQPAFYEVRIAPIEAAGQIDAAIIVATDISDRKQAELALVQLNQALESRVQERTAALQESESRFRQLAETIQQVFWLFDPNSHQNLYVSPAYEQIWGQSLETVYASEWSWADAIHPDDRDRILTLFTNSLTWAHDVEYRIVRPDGTIRWIHDRSFPIRDSEGQIYRVARIAEDITKRKLVEGSLRDRLAFERLIASISTHFVNLNLDDLDAGITDALEQITQFFGVDYSYIVLFSADRSVGYKTYEWLQPGLPPFSEEWDAIPAAPFPWWMDKITHFEPIVIDDRDDLPAAASNERAALEATGIQSLTALPISYSKILMGYIGFATINRCHSWQEDTVTLLQLVGELFANALQRKQAEINLQEQQARLNLALEAVNMGIWEGNLITGAEILSPQAEALLGFAPGTFDGKRETFLSRVHPDDVEQVQLSGKVALQTGVLQDEYRIVLPDQTIRWINCLGKVFYDEAGHPLRVVGVDLDITERKRVEEDLQQAVETNQALLAAIPDLILRISRDGILREGIPAKEASLLLPIDKIVGKSVWEILPTDLACERMDAIEQAFQTGLTQVHEYPVCLNDEWRYEEARCVVCGEDEVMVLVRDITDRKRTEAALQQQLQREQALNRVFQAIRQSLDLEVIFATATAETARLLPGLTCSVVQYLPTRKVWKNVAEFRHNPELPYLIGFEISDVDNPFADQLKRLQTVRVETTSQLEDKLNQNIARMVPGAWLLLPLQVENQVWGSFTLHTSHHPFSWTEEQVTLAQTVAGQLEVAIQQAELYQRVKQEKQKLLNSQMALVQAQQIAQVGSWELDATTQAMVWSDTLFQIFGFDSAAPEPDFAEVMLNYVHPEDRPRLEQYLTQAMTEGSPYEIDLRFFRTDGTMGYMEARAEAVRND